MTMFKKIQAYLSRDAFFKLSTEEQNERARKTPFYKTYLSEKTIADNSPSKLDLETAKKALGLSAYKNRLKNATNSANKEYNQILKLQLSNDSVFAKCKSKIENYEKYLRKSVQEQLDYNGIDKDNKYAMAAFDSVKLAMKNLYLKLAKKENEVVERCKGHLQRYNVQWQPGEKDKTAMNMDRHEYYREYFEKEANKL